MRLGEVMGGCGFAGRDLGATNNQIPFVLHPILNIHTPFGNIDWDGMGSGSQSTAVICHLHLYVTV